GVAVRPGLAVDAESAGLPVVSQHAAVPPGAARRLGRRLHPPRRRPASARGGIHFLLTDPANVVMMAELRQPDGRLEAGQLHAILAQVAVHVRTAVDGLLGPFGEGVAEQPMRVEAAGAENLPLWMRPGELLRLPANAFFQHSGEEEEGKYDDA